MATSENHRRVLLLEINEITWDLVDPLIEKGVLPTFALLKANGAWAKPMSIDLPPHLDPWITWTTVYSGRPRAQHNVSFLQQPPETIGAKRIWEHCHDNGLSVGVFGSLCSWPPQPVDGFYVPDTFAQDFSTHPPELSPIQKLNLTYTRSIRLPSDQDGLLFKARLGLQLLKLGLRPATVTQIVKQIALERIKPDVRWRRVALQPFVNHDFFSSLYRRHRPRYASFHTNHVAHYMHTYWKAMTPHEFLPLETSDKERRTYGNAIEFGYQAADRLIRQVLKLIDEDTLLVVASSMGQKPYKSSLRSGKKVGQIRSLDRLVEILGYEKKVRAVAMMSDQFNIYGEAATLAEIREALDAVYVDELGHSMFRTTLAREAITVTLAPSDRITSRSECFFPQSPGAPRFPFQDLVYQSGQVKSGCHDPQGMLLMYGPGVRPGQRIDECDNLDIAPTIMTLLGLPVPREMEGRVLEEAFTMAQRKQLTEPKLTATAARV